MATYFVKRKKNIILEEDATTAQAQATPAPAPAQPAQTNQPAPAANPAPAQATATAAPAQNATASAAPAQDANQQPVNNAAQQTQDNANNEKSQKITNCLNQITELVKKNDPYILLTINIPDMIKEADPTFDANNAEAKDAITKWGEFKKNPSADNFNNFTNAVAAYGNGNQQAATAETTPQNAPTVQAESEFRAMTFSQRLNESLSNRLKISNATKSAENYNHFNF